jgi:hypothetical protein
MVGHGIDALAHIPTTVHFETSPPLESTHSSPSKSVCSNKHHTLYIRRTWCHAPMAAERCRLLTALGSTGGGGAGG